MVRVFSFVSFDSGFQNMSVISADQLVKISKTKPPAANVKSLVDALEMLVGGLDQPHRLAQFLTHVMHESGGLKFNKEIWGPTPAQKRYEGRKDLGNTQKGDGSKYRGYGLGQLTGRANVTRFWKWCVAKHLNPPDFVAKPSLIATDVWSALSAVWFWDEGNRTGKSLNRYADANDIEMITKIWNGGLNGYEDRIDYYTRSALVLCGYGPKDVAAFQKVSGLESDGIAGPKTRAALHKTLVSLTLKPQRSEHVAPAPVVETVPVPVAPKSLEAPWYKSKEFWLPTVTGGGLTGGATVMEKFGSVPWQNLLVLMIGAFVLMTAILLIRRHQTKKEVHNATV